MMWVSKKIWIVGLVMLSVSLQAQIGGKEVFTFLNLSPSSRISALGGSAIGDSEDLASAYLNPASLTDTLRQALTFQHQFLFAGIQQGYAGVAKQLTAHDVMLHGGFHYVLYGEFDAFDEFGIAQGQANASDLAITVGASYAPYEKLRVGVNIKGISSRLDQYRSSGLAVDLGAHYQTAPGGTQLSLVLRNAGVQFSPFGETREKLPVDLQFGIAKRLKHLPFQFAIIFHHLNQWNLSYENPSQEGGFLFGPPQDLTPSGFDNFMRHMIFNGEFLIGKNDTFRVRFGYNHQRKQELSVTNFQNLTGFSAGFGIRIRRLTFDYALSKIHFAATTHHIGISTNLGYFSGSRIL
ncbi:MAG: type IX secretion system protein PorQ [Saprospiraceae bacterium]|nr:type IX secretion system protein PorQ [Saprospiraceae bacterium]